ncbi:FAD-binding protein [Pseudoponticoccus marisrubri]|uniref:2-hydroxy-acid oxidase n=1 Tax=Pseudoponticoccus marisrubri TaxID=1685382 RepID=A0A0W7WJJ8_9RHOB|nr:FAD-binding protein [Pseudoponticoccus marisrubri]KUF10708.1 2-hydroxy-acid oxidase [Pseudoponticoccus marisrubri]
MNKPGLAPETEAQLAEAVRDAKGPLCLQGGGTRGVTCDGDVLDTRGLSGITLYEPGALTLAAQAGTPLDEIEAALRAEGQRLPFEPMDPRGLLGTSGAPTIGGVVAGNVSGPRRLQAGACRDYMLGVRFVDGMGTVIKNGGRVMKNVTGYDLVKLMTGSWGSLGALSEVSLKVLPRPEAAACLLVDGLDVAQAVQLMAEAMGSPYEITGAAHDPESAAGQPVTMLRIEGFAQSVAYRASALQAMFGLHEVRVESDPEAVADTWRRVRDVDKLHGRDGDVWRISCKPSDAPELALRLQAEAQLFDWAGGLIWALLPAGTDARERLGAYDGYATQVRGTGDLPMFQPQPAAIAALSRGLKQRFDPRGILNPGILV